MDRIGQHKHEMPRPSTCLHMSRTKSVKLKLEITNYVIKKGRKEKTGAYDENNINSEKCYIRYLM